MQRSIDEYQALLLQRAYDDLERAAVEARTNASLISDGQPRLAAIYGGTAGCVCGNQLTEELWKLRGERLREWRDRHPESVTARVALATYPLRYGWLLRGGGYSSTVSQDASKQFASLVENARNALTGLDASTKEDAGWFEAMLDVAVAQGWPRDRFDALYEEAVRRHPGYLPLYFSAASYYSPKWYGSVKDLQQFIDRAVDATRSKMGETLYARLVWAESGAFHAAQVDWPRMKAGFERLIRDFPDPWNINHYARFACSAGDWETMAKLAKRIGDKPVAAAWSGGEHLYQICRKNAGAARAKTP
ncbi:MAG TPA: hypothetical protein VJO54_00385 [Burkholderiales bacterium]|nr:hypothetical protein [Burkholderiales bacterium]